MNSFYLTHMVDIQLIMPGKLKIVFGLWYFYLCGTNIKIKPFQKQQKLMLNGIQIFLKRALAPTLHQPNDSTPKNKYHLQVTEALEKGVIDLYKNVMSPEKTI